MKNIIIILLLPIYFTLMAQPQQVQLLDDFNNYPLNSFGEDTNVFFDTLGSSIILQTAKEFGAYCHTGKSLQIDYEVTVEEGFVGFVSILPLMDLTDYHYLSFWVKGVEGGEYFQVELKRQNGESAKVAVRNYLPCGITKEWQKVVIPLDAFWNLTERQQLEEFIIVVDNYSSSANGAPLEGGILLDNILFGSYFPGFVKIDPFSDHIGTNATGGNNGAFSQSGAENYYSELECQGNLAVCGDCRQKIHFDNGNEDLFGGTFYKLGGGNDGWTGIGKNLEQYDTLYLEAWAESAFTNPGNVKVELQSDGAPYFTYIYGIDINHQAYSVPISALESFGGVPLTPLDVSQLALVFERNQQEVPAGELLVDNLEFRAAGYTFPDIDQPCLFSNLKLDGSPPAGLTTLNPGTTGTVSVSIENSEPKLESIHLEYKKGCDWYCLNQKFAPFNEQEDLDFLTNDLPHGIPLEMRLVFENYNGKTCNSELFLVQVSGEALTVNKLLRDAFNTFQFLRHETGVYLDATVFEGQPFHPASVATTGPGLISLCIGDAMGYIDNAEELVIETLQSMNGMRPGFEPERNEAGWFRHFINQDTGAQAWDSEYSSIDSGILVACALFCKKYFSDNQEISDLADCLYLSIDWSTMIADPVTGGIYLTANEEGEGSGITLPFNEYMIVAWLARNDFRNNEQAVALWNQHYADATALPTRLYTTESGEEIEVLTDHPDHFLSNFVPQFAYYYCHDFAVDQVYLQYLENAMRADTAWWREHTNTACFVWGFGAGASCNWVESGYNADNIGYHPGTIASPHIIAGFIPIRPNLIEDLFNQYTTPLGVYQLPDEAGTPVQWRFSTENLGWEACDIQGIDYSTMLYGLAAHPEALGTSFFELNNDFDFPMHNPECIVGATEESLIPGLIELHQNYPNPFTESTVISFDLFEKSSVVFNVFNANGEKVYQENLGVLMPSNHQISWNATDHRGNQVPTAMYYYQLQSSSFSLTQKMVLLRH